MADQQNTPRIMTELETRPATPPSQATGRATRGKKAPAQFLDAELAGEMGDMLLARMSFA